MMVEKVPHNVTNSHIPTNEELVGVLNKSAAQQIHWDMRLKVLETLFDGRGPLDSYIMKVRFSSAIDYTETSFNGIICYLACERYEGW